MTCGAGSCTTWALSCAAVLALTGCGGNDSSKADQPPVAAEESAAATASSVKLPDPCKLLTDEEINAVLETMNNGYKTSARKFTPFPDIGGGQCDIEAKNGEGFTTSFSISVSPVSTGSVFIESGTRKPIPGIGEQAFEARDNYYAFTKGVIVHIVNAPGRSQATSSAELLRAAVGRV